MKNLRELAKDFAQGRSTQEQYREQRTKLIQGIMAGTFDVKDHNFEAPLPPPDPDITQEGGYDPFATTEIAVTKPKARKKTSAPKPQPIKPQPKKTERLILITIAIMLLILIVLLAFYFSLKIISTDSTIKVTKSSFSQSQPIQSTAADQLIQDFLAKKNWQTSNLDQFIQDWEQLSESEQTQAMESARIAQLKNAIYKRILEERAMMALGDVESGRQKQELLVQFSNQLGFQDDRIAVTE